MTALSRVATMPSISGCQDYAEEEGTMGNPKSGSDVVYILTEEDLRPADSVLLSVACDESNATAVLFSRVVPGTASPRDIPDPLSDEEWLSEIWVTNDKWVSRNFNGIESGLASRLVVRLSWPLDSEAETALLLAKLSHPSLRVAVRLDPAEGNSAFRYFNRLALPWIALPHNAVDAAWADLLTELARAWCFDPAASAAVEPLASGFWCALSARMTGRTQRWTSRIVSTDGRETQCEWSPTLHAIVASAAAGSLLSAPEVIADVDRRWIASLATVCDTIDTDRMMRLARVRGAATVMEAPDDL